MNYYLIAGLTVSSPIPLVGVLAIDKPEQVAVTLIPDNSLQQKNPLQDQTFSRISQHCYWLRWPSGGLFCIEGSCRIRYQLLADDDFQLAQLLLSSSVFWLLCHQRGLVVLHACAFQQGDELCAVAGASGMGKSTLAAFIAQQGLEVFSDDVCVLHPHQGQYSLQGGWEALKLWQPALNALNLQNQPDLQRCHRREQKFFVPGLLSTRTAHQPLTRLYLLHRLPDHQSPYLVTVSGHKAFLTLLQQMHYMPMLTGSQLLMDLWPKVKALAPKLRIKQLHRPRTFSALPAVLDLILHDGQENT